MIKIIREGKLTEESIININDYKVHGLTQIEVNKIIQQLMTLRQEFNKVWGKNDQASFVRRREIINKNNYLSDKLGKASESLKFAVWSHIDDKIPLSKNNVNESKEVSTQELRIISKKMESELRSKLHATNVKITNVTKDVISVKFACRMENTNITGELCYDSFGGEYLVTSLIVGGEDLDMDDGHGSLYSAIESIIDAVADVLN